MPRPPAPLDRDAELAIFAAELGDCPELDLHGLDSNIAIAGAERFLHGAFIRGIPAIRLIHGIGTGRLRLALHAWLRRQSKVVDGFRDAATPHEAGAVTYVALVQK
jgi:DNA mismatch repair protein MutS2